MGTAVPEADGIRGYLRLCLGFRFPHRFQRTMMRKIGSHLLLVRMVKHLVKGLIEYPRPRDLVGNPSAHCKHFRRSQAIHLGDGVNRTKSTSCGGVYEYGWLGSMKIMSDWVSSSI